VTPHQSSNDRTNKYVSFISSDLKRPRFYRGRYGLMDNFDDLNLPLDEELWFLITPKGIARSHAQTIAECPDAYLVLDAFCGIGGDTLYMPSRAFVVGCDIKHERVTMARSLNDKFGSTRVDFILADSVKAKSCFRPKAFDVVYLSPPWGHDGIRNRRVWPVFGARRMSSLAVDGTRVFQRALSLVKNFNIAYYLPRGMDEREIVILAELTGNGDRVHVDVHESYDPDDDVTNESEKYKVRAITAYFGHLADIH
jgi:hypothetical protein